MSGLVFIAAFLATLGSIIWLTKIAVQSRHSIELKSLSERAATTDQLLTTFRIVLVTCSTLFSVSIYLFIAPRLHNGIPAVIAWTCTYIGILLAAALPARDKTLRSHIFAAQCMGAGMLVLAYIFWKSLSGSYASIELAIAICMSLLAVLTYIDMKRYIIHELAFIYLNHVTIVVAAIALLHV